MMFKKEVLVLEVLARNLGTWMSCQEVTCSLGNGTNEREVRASLDLLVRTGHATTRDTQRRLVYKERFDHEGEGVKIAFTEFQITNQGYQKFRGSQVSAGSLGLAPVPSFSI